MLVEMFMAACLYGVIAVSSNTDIFAEDNKFIHIKVDKKKVILIKEDSKGEINEIQNNNTSNKQGTARISENIQNHISE